MSALSQFTSMRHAVKLANKIAATGKTLFDLVHSATAKMTSEAMMPDSASEAKADPCYRAQSLQPSLLPDR